MTTAAVCWISGSIAVSDWFDERVIVRSVMRAITAAGITVLAVCFVWWSALVRRRQASEHDPAQTGN